MNSSDQKINELSSVHIFGIQRSFYFFFLLLEKQTNKKIPLLKLPFLKKLKNSSIPICCIRNLLLLALASIESITFN